MSSSTSAKKQWPRPLGPGSGRGARGDAHACERSHAAPQALAVRIARRSEAGQCAPEGGSARGLNSSRSAEEVRCSVGSP